MTKGSASAVDKALDLLEAIARSTTPMKLSELAEEVGMLRPTAHRVLGELANRGWVFRYDGRYLPGRLHCRFPTKRQRTRWRPCAIRPCGCCPRAPT